jgi:hypothetical protein
MRAMHARCRGARWDGVGFGERRVFQSGARARSAVVMEATGEGENLSPRLPISNR